MTPEYPHICIYTVQPQGERIWQKPRNMHYSEPKNETLIRLYDGGCEYWKRQPQRTCPSYIIIIASMLCGTTPYFYSIDGIKLMWAYT